MPKAQIGAEGAGRYSFWIHTLDPHMDPHMDPHDHLIF
jgi:hypothetical protein